MNLFEIKVVYQRQTGEDNPGLVKETYVASGMTPADVQNQVVEHIAPMLFGELEVPSIRKRNFFDVFKNENADNWYEVKVAMITVDGDRETRKEVLMLVQAIDIHDAANVLSVVLSSYDCEVISIIKSPVVEVLEAKPAKEEE